MGDKMNEPLTNGCYCSAEITGLVICPYFVRGICVAYNKILKIEKTIHDGRYLRHKDCIVEHGLTTGNPWTTEPPTEPGWYIALPVKGVKPVCVHIRKDINTGVLSLFNDILNGASFDRICLLGPRIEFPELPGEEGTK